MRPRPPWSPARAHEILSGIRAPVPVLLALQSLQEEFGFVHGDAVPLTADVLNVSRADVFGVLTYYRDLRREPPPAVEVQVCMGEACQAVGARGLRGSAEALAGPDTEVRDVFCLGNCALGPTAVVNGRIIGRATGDQVSRAVVEAAGAS